MSSSSKLPTLRISHNEEFISNSIFANSGLPPKVILALDSLCDSGAVVREEVDNRILQSLRLLAEDVALGAIANFRADKRRNIRNKTGYFAGYLARIRKNDGILLTPREANAAFPPRSSFPSPRLPSSPLVSSPQTPQHPSNSFFSANAHPQANTYGPGTSSVPSPTYAPLGDAFVSGGTLGTGRAVSY